MWAYVDGIALVHAPMVLCCRQCRTRETQVCTEVLQLRHTTYRAFICVLRTYAYSVEAESSYRRDVRVFRLQPRGWAMTAAMRPLAGELRGAPPGVDLEVGGEGCSWEGGVGWSAVW